jgi:anti-anti-sigma factor
MASAPVDPPDRSLPGSVESGHYAPGLAFVRLRGEHDLFSEATLTSALDRAVEHSNVLVDLSECTFMDSTVITLLIRAAQAAEARGERLVLAIPPGQTAVARVAQIVHLGEFMPVYSSTDEALAILQ